MTDTTALRSRYSALPDEAFATLVEEWFNDPSGFTPEACAAVQLAMQDRNTSVAAVVHARIQQTKEQKAVEAVREARTDKRLAREGGWLGVAGVVAAVVGAVPSALQGHLGGLAAAAVTLCCSVFLIVQWRRGRV